MIRKEKIIIGMESEVRDYYLNQLKEVKTDESGETVSNCVEFRPFDSQVKLLTNGLGIIFYHKIKKTPKGPKLSLERIFVWIIPEVKNESQNA